MDKSSTGLSDVCPLVCPPGSIFTVFLIINTKSQFGHALKASKVRKWIQGWKSRRKNSPTPSFEIDISTVTCYHTFYNIKLLALLMYIRYFSK